MQIKNETQARLVEYLCTRDRAGAGELASLVGITVPAVRVHLLELMAQGLVSREKTGNYRVWFFAAPGLKEEETAMRGKRVNSNTTIKNRRINNVNVD